MIFRYIYNKRSYLNRICIACEQGLSVSLSGERVKKSQGEGKESLNLTLPLHNFFTPSPNREPVHRLEGILARGRKPRSIGIFR